MIVMWKNPILILGLALTTTVALWGLFDTTGLAAFAVRYVEFAFVTRGWFVMVLMTSIVVTALYLAFSRYGDLRLGHEDEEPEFSTVTWITMMFAAGMGVGLLYWSAAEPLSHFALARQYTSDAEAARLSLFLTNFHWGIHAWAMFGLTGLVLAYFSFRRGAPQLLSAPVIITFGDHVWTRWIGGLINVLAIYAVAIGVAGTIGMGLFQVRDGIQVMSGGAAAEPGLTIVLFGALCIGFLIPLTVDLSRGMGTLSNAAFAIAVSLMLFVLLTGPTSYIMSGLVDAFGTYLEDVIPQGFRTYTFFDQRVRGWFADWTLTYMVWYISWAPFVGVFIARISRGRTIREYLLAVMLLPSLFAVLWYGTFGGVAFFETLEGEAALAEAVNSNLDGATFVLLEMLPLSVVTQSAVIVSGFLFIITSVVSASLVLAMFTDSGSADPSVRIKLTWGGIVAALGLVMVLVDDIELVRNIIVMAALPFVLILPLLYISLLKSLRRERSV